MPYTIIKYTKASGKVPYVEYLKELIKKHKTIDLTAVRLYTDKLQEFGMKINEEFSPGAIKHLEGKIWELKPRENRVLFFYQENQEIVLLHGFYKTTNKTPKSEINKAIREMNDYKERKTTNDK